MSDTRPWPSMERLIRDSRNGLYFKDGAWTANASEATLFSSISEAMRVRSAFRLEDIQLVVRSGSLQHSNLPAFQVIYRL